MLLAHVVVSTYVMLLACVIPLACLIVMAPTRCHLELFLMGANSLRFLWPPLTFTAAKLLPDPVAIFTPLAMLIASTSTSPVWFD